MIDRFEDMSVEFAQGVLQGLHVAYLHLLDLERSAYDGGNYKYAHKWRTCAKEIDLARKDHLAGMVKAGALSVAQANKSGLVSDRLFRG